MVDMDTGARPSRLSGTRGSLASIRAGLSQSHNLMTGALHARGHRNKLITDAARLICVGSRGRKNFDAQQ
jgi:hypothetical protein